MFRSLKVFGSGSAYLFKYSNHQSFRTLYSLTSLGVDGYLSAREKVKSHLVDNGEIFRTKMNEFLQEDTKHMIFTEDLKNMVHIVEHTPADVELIVKMLKKFNAQNKEVRFGNFIFGPVVMRMFWYLKECDLALQCFKDPSLDGIFDQLITYQILVDMLYESKRYQDVLDVFNIIKSRQIQGGIYPKHVIVLVFAACYKQNTPESFQYSSNLWKELNEVGHVPMRKATTFAAGLAIAHNAPHIAIEILSTVRQQNYMTVRNLKAVALSDLGRPDDALPILRSVLEINEPTQQKHTFTKDVMDKIASTIKASGNNESIQKFNRIEKVLQDNGHVTQNTLDSLLCTEITSTPQSALRKERGVLAASYTSDRSRSYNYTSSNDYSGNNNYTGNTDPRRQRRHRPGLNDLY